MGRAVIILPRVFRQTILIALALFASASFVVAQPRPATAHPLGNFTVNRYVRLEPQANVIHILYVLDMAEIPTFQEMNVIDRDRNGLVSDDERDIYLAQRLPEFARNLRLAVNGTQLPVRAESGTLSFGDGQGGLKILRIDATFLAELPSGLRSGVLDAQFRDGNYDERLGWKEIVVRGTEGAAVRQSSVGAENASDELRSYPDNMLQSPLNLREARFRFEPGVAVSSTAQDAAARVTERTTRAVSPGILSRFAESAATKDLTAQVLVFSLIAAVFWGAVHALGPGHGKTVVAAYLVGSRGTARHAAFLGLTVTATHTASTYILGFVTLIASAIIVPERLYPVLSLLSGLMVVGMGLSLLIGRLRAQGVWPFPVQQAQHEYADGHTHDHDRSDGHGHASAGDGHEHHHHHGHSHAVPGQDGRPVTWRSLLALGLYGGMIPCPTAIVVLLISISLNRVGFGLLLVVAFSLGLAGVLMGIGFALVYAGRTLSRVSNIRGGMILARAVPLVSAGVVVVAGILITLRAAGQSGIPLI